MNSSFKRTVSLPSLSDGRGLMYKKATILIRFIKIAANKPRSVKIITDKAQIVYWLFAEYTV